MQFCCGGGVAECHSGERKEERERREIDQTWSIYGGSEEPMPDCHSGERKEEREKAGDRPSLVDIWRLKRADARIQFGRNERRKAK